MRVLLVEPNYYTQYPPLGLLKFSTLYKQQGHDVRFVRGVVLVSKARPEELSEAIIRVLSDPKYRGPLAEASRAAYRRYFNWDAIAERYAEVLK